MISGSYTLTSYKGLHCMVTGGLGFIGSNLAIRLVEEGARVTVIDSSVPGCGANPFNLSSVVDSTRILDCDIGDLDKFGAEIGAPDVIFNIAGEISHTMSMSDPERDLDINTRAQLRFLVFCRKSFPGVRIVYASTRQLYGRPQYLPADELHPIEPIDFNGIHKLAAGQYHLLFSRRGELDCVVLRLSNVYGPRMALHLRQQGVLNVYLREAVEGRPLTIYGDGAQVRDPVYVDDAVEAFLLAGLASSKKWRVYNIGGPEALSIAEIACAITQASKISAPVRAPFPGASRSIDIGSFVLDSNRALRGLRWQPTTLFEPGIRKSLQYYRASAAQYLLPPECALAQK